LVITTVSLEIEKRMKAKAVSGIMLTLLLLTSMLTLAFKIQPVKADLKTSEAEESLSVDEIRFIHNRTNHNKKGNKEQARIVEHRITSFEMKKLKRRIGVWEEGTTYNLIVNGHGTGLRPPTEEEWAEIVNKTYIVERILLNQTTQSPSSVDHTTKPWFPPIGDQDGEGSCTAWAVGYYMKTFQEAKEHGWNLSEAVWEGGYFGNPSVEYQNRIFSPDFIYHLINGGIDNGSTFYNAINLVSAIGASSWEEMPYDPNDSTTWPSEEAWGEAPLYRGNSSGYEDLELSTDDDLISLKNWIASDHLAVIAVDADQYSYLSSEDFWTLDNYVSPSINHANTIVGYDDNIGYSEEGELRHGAFRIANSWGEGGWENIPDGCFWISYEAMKQRVEHCMFFRDMVDYEPELVASFRMDHSIRAECNITVGMGDESSPLQTKRFDDYVDGGDHPFCPNSVLFDITEFKDAIPTVYNQSFFLEVYDWGTSATGTVSKFAIEYSQSQDTPLYTVNNDYVYADVILLPLETNWMNERLVSLDEDFIDIKISMATDSNGYLYIAYEDWYPAVNQYAIFVRRSTDGGNTWPTIVIGYESTHNLRYPSIAIDPYSNDIFVAVEREWTSSDHDILVLRYVDGVWSWRLVDTDSGDDRYPSITSEYQYVSNWQYISYEYVYTYNDRDLMFAKSTDHGATWSVKKLHGDWPDYNVHAQTSITNAEGYIYIAYKWGADYDSPCEIRVERSTDFGSSWTQLTDIDGLLNGCSFPSIASTHGGSTVMVAFQYDWSANDIDVWYSYSVDSGTSWTKGNPLFTSGLEDETLPALTVDGGGMTENDIRGYFHVVCRFGAYIRYSKAHYDDPSGWSTPEFVNERWVGEGLAVTTRLRDGSEQFYPCVTWTDERTRNIYHSSQGPRTWTVDDDGPADFHTIQEAINAASPRDSIYVKSGTYYEHVIVDKSLSLIGDNRSTTIIDGSGSGTVVSIWANWVNITGFTVRSGKYGILPSYSSNNSISGNHITNNADVGIWLRCSSNNSISGNHITNNINNYGVYLDRSSNIVLRNNIMIGNRYNFVVDGGTLSHFVHDVDESNTVDSKPIYYLVNCQNMEVPSDAGYVALVNSTNITVKGLKLKNNGEGVLIVSTTNLQVINNTITNNVVGVWLTESSSTNSVFANNVTKNTYGVVLVQSSLNSVSENSVTNNYYGVLLEYYSNYNTLSRNNIINNNVGVYVNSSDNKFYHNNVVDNTEQVWIETSEYDNVWDDGYPSGGNYWSEYADVDLYSGPNQNETGSDGIWDHPYTIDADNQDRYPLVEPWTPILGDVNDDGKVDALDLFDLSKAYGCMLGDDKWDERCDFNNDCIVDASDLFDLSKNYGKTDSEVHFSTLVVSTSVIIALLAYAAFPKWRRKGKRIHPK